MTFGEFLRRERLRQKLGLREFARLHGRSYTYLGNVETGKVSPGLDQITEICKLYGVEPWEAVAGFTKAELVKSLLGDVSFDDPVVLELLRLASKPDGVQEIRDILDFSKSNPGKVREVLELVSAMKKVGIFPKE